MLAFTNQVALITGAASGLGKALAMALGKEGAAIAAVDLPTVDSNQIAENSPIGRYAFAAADVTDRESLSKAARDLERQLGPIDLVIASAGLGYETAALTYSAADVERILAVNLIGVSNTIGTVLPGMLERKRGHIVGISSLASFRGMPRMAGYCASKAGLNALLDSIRVEVKGHGITVTTICPGWVRTPMTANLDMPMPGLLEVDDAARRIVAAIKRRQIFYAFPRSFARRLRLLGMLPCGPSDWLLGRILRSLGLTPDRPLTRPRS